MAWRSAQASTQVFLHLPVLNSMQVSRSMTGKSPTNSITDNISPKRFAEDERRRDSATMAIMGPNITALGEIDFIKAQIIPARKITPGCCHLTSKATSR